MARAKNPETAKTPRTRKNTKAATNGNGHAVAVDLEGEIRVRAYEIFRDRGCSPGSEVEDWILAEKEVKAKRASAGA